MNNKKLYKSRENKVLLGICGGIGEYFGIDPVIVRIILVILCLAGFSGVIAYIIAALVIPDAPVMRVTPQGGNPSQAQYKNVVESEATVTYEAPAEEAPQPPTDEQ